MSKQSPTRTALEATAYHEAGHAVLALRLGTGLRRNGVSILADADSAGRVHTGKGFRGDPSVGISDKAQLRMERVVMMCMAGVEAQRVYSAKSVRRYHGGSDNKDAGDLILRLCGGNLDEFKALQKLLLVRVRNLIRSPKVWAEITGVAEALLKTGTLNKEETARVWRESVTRETIDRAKDYLANIY